MLHTRALPFVRPDGRTAAEYTFETAGGAQLSVMEYGARITHLILPASTRNPAVDVVLGYDDPMRYLSDTACFGAVCGRFANRLRGAAFSLGSRRYSLDANDGENTLHGGTFGFHRRFFDVCAVDGGLRCHLVSLDGDMGFPGTLDLTVTYTLTNDAVLRIQYDAFCPDADTIVNLTNHSYFRLDDADDVLDHRLFVNAAFYTPADAALLPTGEIRPVAGTPFDLSAPVRLSALLRPCAPALAATQGLDHNFVLRKEARDALTLAAALISSDGGRRMECWTTRPGLQVYTGNGLSGEVCRGGRAYGPYAGVCLETQLFPDAMTHTHFPSPILPRGQRCRHTTEYRFFEEK